MKKRFNTTPFLALQVFIFACLGLYGQNEWDQSLIIEYEVLDNNSVPITIPISIPQTTTSNRVGAGTSTPKGRLDVSGCLGQTDLATLLIQRPYCGANAGSGLTIPDGIFSGESDGMPPPSQRVAFTNLSLPDLSTATQMFSSLGKPLILTKLGVSSQLGSTTSFRTPFLVDQNGYLGTNVERPRAAADFCGFSRTNEPSMIVGVRAQPHSSYTRHVHFTPNVGLMGWNSISQNGDHGMFFTDGLGQEGSNSSAGFVIAPWADNLFTGGLRMDNMGNVELRGDLRATKVTVDAAWWPDFVFAKDYPLMPLHQLKEYIQTHKHLPAMPSEAEVKTQGQNMGELQKLQQQKIEELTLYTIQQEEMLKAQAAKIAEMEQKINILLNQKE